MTKRLPFFIACLLVLVALGCSKADDGHGHGPNDGHNHGPNDGHNHAEDKK